MALYKTKSGIYYYDFYVGNRRYRRSTKTDLESKAKKIEAVAFAGALEFGPDTLTNRNPTLTDFGDKHFLPWVRESHSLKETTRRYYQKGWDLLKRTDLIYMRMNQVTSGIIDRLRLSGASAEEISPSYRNQALRTLRRAFGLAAEWQFIRQIPRVHLDQENERDELITPERERLLLEHSGPTLTAVIIFVQDTGARPEEIFRMRVEDLDWTNMRILNRSGKSKNSRRYLAISDRMVPHLRGLAGSRSTGWLFLSDSKSGHLTTVAKMFRLARERAGLPDTVVLYSGRHTFGTDILNGTKNPAVTMKAMGHGSTKMMMRYQHPDYVEPVRQAINRRNATNTAGQVLSGADQEPTAEPPVSPSPQSVGNKVKMDDHSISLG